MIESGNDGDKKRIKVLLNDTDKELKKMSEKTPGAKVLLKKLTEIWAFSIMLYLNFFCQLLLNKNDWSKANKLFYLFILI